MLAAGIIREAVLASYNLGSDLVDSLSCHVTGSAKSCQISVVDKLCQLGPRGL